MDIWVLLAGMVITGLSVVWSCIKWFGAEKREKMGMSLIVSLIGVMLMLAGFVAI